MRLSKRVFEIDKIFMGVIPKGDNACRFNYQTLEDAIKEVIRTKLNDPNALMENTNPTPNHVPTFVVATNALHADSNPTLFRSYGCKGSNPNKCFIWEAARATSAAPTFFKPITIAVPAPGNTFVDGGLTYNNPAEPALEEAQRLWPDSSKCCLVSIGTGRLSSVKISQTSNLNESSGSRFGTWIPGRQLVGNLSDGVQAVTAIAEACVRLTTNSEPLIPVNAFRIIVSMSNGICKILGSRNGRNGRRWRRILRLIWRRAKEFRNETGVLKIY
jgi:predicted acylesterase/phospholipase RssA